MQTRFTSLLKLKKNIMQKSEKAVQRANADLNSASISLKISYTDLDDVELPSSGNMSELLASRTILKSQRGLIQHNQDWVKFAKEQVDQVKERLKLDMIEFEKFKYLEVQEIKKELKRQKDKDAKELDEIALITFGNKNLKKA